MSKLPLKSDVLAWIQLLGESTSSAGLYLPTAEDVSKNDEFCDKNEEFCIENEEFCVKNEEFCIENEELCDKNEELCIENDGLCIENEEPCIKKDGSCRPLCGAGCSSTVSMTMAGSGMIMHFGSMYLRICIINDEIFIKSDEFCIKSDEFCMQMMNETYYDAGPAGDRRRVGLETMEFKNDEI